MTEPPPGPHAEADSTSAPGKSLPAWNVFVCYRRAGGQKVADLIRGWIDDQEIEVDLGGRRVPHRVAVFQDRLSSASSNWRAQFLNQLRESHALIVVCTPTLGVRVANDHCRREIREWLTLNPGSKPVVVDATGDWDSYGPPEYRREWRKMNLIEIDRSDATELHEAESTVLQRRLLESICSVGVRTERDRLTALELAYKRQRRGTLFASIVAGLALLLAYSFLRERDRAERGELEQQKAAQRALAAEAEARSAGVSTLIEQAQLESNALQMDREALRLWQAIERASPDDRRRDGLLRALAGRFAGLTDWDLWGADNPARVAYAFDGQAIATTAGRRVLVWRTDQMFADAHWLDHDAPITDLYFGSRKNLLATGSGHRVDLWDHVSGEHLFALDSAAKVSSLAFGPDGRLLAVSTNHAGCSIWDVDMRQRLPHLDVPLVMAIAFSPDGRYLALLTSTDLRVWDLARNALVGNPQPLTPFGEQMLFDTTNRLIAVRVGTGEAMKLWRIEDDQLIPARTISSSVPIAFGGDWCASFVVNEGLSLLPIDRILDGGTSPPPTPDSEVGGIHLRSLAFSRSGNVYVEKRSNAVSEFDVRERRFVETTVDRQSHLSAVAGSLSGRSVSMNSRERTSLLISIALHPKRIPRDVGEMFLDATHGLRDARSAEVVRTKVDLFDPMVPVAPKQTFHFEQKADGIAVCSAGIAARSESVWSMLSADPPTDDLRVMPTGQAFAYSIDGARAMIANAGDALVVDARTGVSEAILTAPAGQTVQRLSSSRDGNTLAWYTSANEICVHQVAPHKLIASVGVDHTVTDLVLSPDGRKLATIGTIDGHTVAELWRVEVDSGRLRSVSTLDHADAFDAAFAHDGSSLLTVARNAGVRRWEADSGRAMPGPPALAPSDLVFALSRDADHVVIGSADQGLRVLAAADWQTVGHPISLDAESIRDLVQRTRGSAMAVGPNSDGRVTVYVMRPRNAIRLLDHVGRDVHQAIPMPEEVVARALHPQGGRLATISSSGKLRIWNTATGKDLGEPMLHDEHVFRLEFGPDPSTVVVANTQRAYVWDVVARRRETIDLHSPNYTLIFVNAGGSRVLLLPPDAPARLVTLDDQRVDLLAAETPRPDAVGFSPDGSYAYTVTGTTVQLLESATGRPFGAALHHSADVSGVSIGPRGTVVVTMSNNLVYVWDVATGVQIMRPLHQNGSVVAFSDDDRWIAIQGSTNDLIVWDIGSGVALTPHLQPHAGVILGARFGPGSSWVETETRTHVHRWQIPPPLADAASDPLLETAIEAMTQLTSDNLGSIRKLSLEEVLERIARLQAAGRFGASPALRFGSGPTSNR